MVYLGELKEISEGKYLPGMIHYMPFDEENGLGKTEDELSQEGILIEELPELETIENKIPVLYCNPTTKEVWYEQVDADIPPTPRETPLEQRVSEQEQQIQSLNIAMAQILGM